jgi:hypothetical protein
MAAMKEAVSFAQRAAIPRSFQLLTGGMTAVISASLNMSSSSFVSYALSARNASGAKEGQLLLKSIGKREGAMLLMDRAYEYNKTRAFAEKLGLCSRRASETQPQKALEL